MNSSSSFSTKTRILPLILYGWSGDYGSGQSNTEMLMIRVIDGFQVSTSGGQTCGQGQLYNRPVTLRERAAFYLWALMVRP